MEPLDLHSRRQREISAIKSSQAGQGKETVVHTCGEASENSIDRSIGVEKIRERRAAQAEVYAKALR